MMALTNPAISRAARALTLASAGTLCLLAAGALGITVLGTVYRPGVVLDLPAPAVPKNASSRQATIPAPPPVSIDKVILAGRALIADPALIENSPQGPLPRIADDGRKPMAAYAAPALNGKFRIAIVVS